MFNKHYQKKLVQAQERIEMLTKAAVNSEGDEFVRMSKQVNCSQLDVKNYSEKLGIKK
tara:strand:+ start:246 stop:419 length:174 start_codon:yes stop_codon:yes gene_type:complete